MSLVGAIFGQKSCKKGKERGTDVFSASNYLAGKLQHKNLTKKDSNEFAKADNEKMKKDESNRKCPNLGKEVENDDRSSSKTDYFTAKRNKIDPKNVSNNFPTSLAEERTIFVGNLPIDTTRKSLSVLFRKCGSIESTRLRSIATSGVKVAPDKAGNQRLVKKICANTNQIDTSVKSSAQGYVVFVDKDSVEKALEMNNMSIGNHLIRVDKGTNTVDSSRSVFVGNLPYQADEASLREHFCRGCELKPEEIENVRIVRDRESMQCKGFGYILFRGREMVPIALKQIHESLYKNRVLRVTVCGKRCKKKHGKEGEGKKLKANKKSSAVGALHRILKNQGKERKRVVLKGGTSNNRLSRRQAMEVKLKKRHKKLQKRAARGMGKMKQR